MIYVCIDCNKQIQKCECDNYKNSSSYENIIEWVKNDTLFYGNCYHFLKNGKMYRFNPRKVKINVDKR